MYRPPADPSEPDKVGVYVVYSVCLVTCTPSDPVGPSHLRTRWCGISCIHYYVCHYNVCTYSFPPAPPPAPPHPPSSPCHIVTHTTLVTQVVSWPLTPPPCNFIHKYMPLRCVHVSGLCRPTTLERQQGPMVPIA